MSADQMTDREFLQKFEHAAEAVIKRREYLSELDMIGDADFGVNISRGFEEVIRKLSSLQEPDVGSILSMAGDVFAFEVGATIGGLLGQALLGAGSKLQGKKVLTATDFATMLSSMLSTIKRVGGASVGDKTIVDALEPAANAATRAADSGRGIKETIEQAASAAEQGAKSTEGMVSRKGRSSYLDERSRGKEDPGAAFVSIFLGGI